MANKGTTVSRKTFQNATRTVEVTVKSIPKEISSNKPMKQYKRNCQLQKENERIADLRNNNMEQNRLEKAKQKTTDQNFNINVTKKKRSHNCVQPGSTWGDTLRANDFTNSTNHAESISISSHSDSGIDDEVSLVENNVNRVLLSSKDVDNQRKLNYNGQHYVTRNENIGVQTIPTRGPSEVPRNRDMVQQTSKIYPIKEVYEESQRIPQLDINDTSRNSRTTNSRASKRIKTRNVSIQCKRMEESTQKQETHDSQVQTQQIQPQHVSERLLSEDAAASPFGESGIQILHQLRQRLQTVGDSESSHMLASFFQSYLSVAGSGARLQGARSSHPSTASPVFPPVFETPLQSNKEGYEKELTNLREELAIKESAIEKMKTISTQLIKHQEYLASKKREFPKAKNDDAVSTNNNKSSSLQNSENKSSSNHIESRKTVDSQTNPSLLHYQTENDILREEVRRQRELIATLELQLTRLFRELENEKSRSRSANSIPLSNINSQRSEISDTASRRLVIAGKKASEQNSNLSESEADSAFAEKSGSQLTSKMGSPHSGGEDLEPRNLISRAQLSVEHLRENQSGMTMTHVVKPPNSSTLKLVPTLLSNQYQQLRFNEQLQFNDSHPSDTALLGTYLRPMVSETLANALTVPGPIPAIQISQNIDRQTVENSQNVQINSSVRDIRGKNSSSRDLEASRILSKYAVNLPLNLSVGTEVSNISRDNIYQGAVNFSSMSDLEHVSGNNQLPGRQSLISDVSSSEESVSGKMLHINNSRRYLTTCVSELPPAATSTPQNEVNFGLFGQQNHVNCHYVSASVVGSGARMESTRLHEIMDEESTFAPLQDVDATKY